MSINITVHGNSLNFDEPKNYLIDNERAKKDEYEKRKKQRIEQVRQKSKEIATQLRRNVEHEKRKQLEKIDKIKKDELLRWREQAAAQVKNQYDNILEKDIGNAHKIAQKQPEMLIPCDGKKRWLKSEKKLPIKNATGKLNSIDKKPVTTTKTMTMKKQNNTKLTPKSKILCTANREKLNDENSSNIVNIETKKTTQTDGSKKRFHPTKITKTKISSKASQVKDNEISSSSVSSVGSSPKMKKKAKLIQTPSVVMEIDSDSDSSSVSLNIEDTHNLSNMQYSRIKTKHSSLSPSPEISKKRKNITKNDDRKKIISSVLSKPTQQTRFTQISDLIRQKSQEGEEIRSGERINRRQSPRKTNLQNQQQFEGSCRVTRSTSMSPKRYTRKNSPTRSPVKTICSTPSSPKKEQKFDVISKSISVSSPKKSIKSIISTKSNANLSDRLSKQTQKNRVQFYDYNNKFEKRYEPPSNVVHNENISYGLNAMERAEIEAELQECKQKELEKLKKISDERCQRALEREQIRKDYEALTAKLDAINKDKNAQKEFKGNGYLFSNVRLKNAEEQQQQKLNTEIINIIKRPTIVTCPDIENSNIKNNLSDFNLAETEKNNFNNIHTIVNSSSDSCSSILLQYVTDETKKISNNIANCDNAQKIHKLQLLLNKINNLRIKLMNEIKNLNNNLPWSKENFQEIFNSIESVQKEREEILNNKEDKKKQNENTKEMNEEKMKEKFEKKEKELKRREAILEKKLKDLYKTTSKLPDEKKGISKDNNNQFETGSITSACTATTTDKNQTEILASEKPIKIVIKVQNQNNKKSFKSPRKRLLTSNPRKMAKDQNIEKPISIQRSPVKSPIVESQINKNSKLKSPNKNLIEDEKRPESKNIDYDEQNETSCTMTSYRSLPNKVKSLLTSALNEKKMEMKELGKEKMKNINVETIEPSFKKNALIPINKKNQIHPQLMRYIQRLLGMSHQAIEMLGVSTSEIETPSSSIVNNSGNLSTTESESFERNKIERLKKFIQDNYTFLNEIDESLKRDASIISNDFNDIKTIEEIWKQAFQRKKKPEIKDTTKNTTKPILKKIKTPTPKKKSDITPIDIDREKSKPFSVPISELPKRAPVAIDDTLKLRQTETETKTKSGAKKELIGKYNELTEHCAQRIAELNEMIVKVREEKQKILEITLSSGGETARTSTEYADFREQCNTVDKSGSNKMSDKQKTLPTNVSRSPEKILLEKNKITGVSRDSGISLSRPVTALGSHESPDMPSSIQEDFEPILKDIPKPSKTKPIVLITPSSPVTETITISGNKSKKEKPPVTLDRYSPQFGEELQPPHELSTIVEVDTPVTSRLNTSITDKQTDDKIALKNDLPLNIEKFTESIKYQKFPSFSEYVKLYKLDLSQLDDNTLSRAQFEYEEIINKIETHQNKIENNNGQQTPILMLEIKSLIESLKLFNLSFKKFPSRKEYMDEMGITDSFDSKNIEITEYAEIFNKDQNKTNSSMRKEKSTESLLDVVEELKRRNMLQESFQHDDVPEKDELLEYDIFETTISSSSNKNNNNKKNKSISIKKKLQSVKNRSPTADVIDSTLSGIEEIPPTTSAPTTASRSSNRSHSDDIEKDLQKMGLTWAATMIRKSQSNRKELASTSSSITKDVSPSKRESLAKSKFDKTLKSIKKEFSDVTNESDTYKGQRLNLREFLAKELQKRTITSSASNSIMLSSSEGSLTSQFLKSLLGSSSSRSSDKRSDHVKTSTPINVIRSTSRSLTSPNSHNNNVTDNDNHSQKFFSGDSRPSSVNYSNNEMDSTNKQEKNIKKSNNEKSKQNS